MGGGVWGELSSTCLWLYSHYIYNMTENYGCNVIGFWYVVVKVWPTHTKLRLKMTPVSVLFTPFLFFSCLLSYSIERNSCWLSVEMLVVGFQENSIRSISTSTSYRAKLACIITHSNFAYEWTTPNRFPFPLQDLQQTNNSALTIRILDWSSHLILGLEKTELDAKN